MSDTGNKNLWAQTYVDLLAEKYGGQALACSDDFFAEQGNLVKAAEPVFIDGKYTDRGKWMDGWESRRRRDGGYDWCILRLGLKGVVRAINVDTTFFRGNAPASISIDACFIAGDPDAQTVWQPLLVKTVVAAHSQNLFEIDNAQTWSHVRLNIFPDGGVARLRLYGEPRADWSTLMPGELVDLAASVNGGRALACSDMFFSAMNNLLAPGRGINMGDGWETKRRRGPGYDWVIVQLGRPGRIQRLVVDTLHFKGNYPDRCCIDAAFIESGDASADNVRWIELLPEQKLQAHREHSYQTEILDRGSVFTHVRLNIFPDGGVSRLHVLAYPEGKPA